jgi:gliding motility-associated-like protein
VYDNPAYTSLMLTNLDVSLGTIYITDARGCETSARFKVTDNYCCTIVVPNAFTPNNDGLNDKLNLVTRSEFYDFKIIIYNRWGQKVFESADYATSWNGFLQSAPCDMGTYFYYLEYTCAESKQRKKERGDITLIK